MESFWTSSKPAAVLALSGEDSAAFVQSQFSGDLRGGPGRAAVGLWLDHRAGIHGVSTVLKVDEALFLILSSDTPGAQLTQKLEAHIIADDVSLEDRTADCGSLFLADERMLAAIDLPRPAASQGALLEAGVALLPSHQIEGGWELVGPREAIEAAWMARLRASGRSEADVATLALERIRHGWPRIPAEVGKEETPSEAGLLAFCSLEKGCYLGQEVVNRQARLDRAARRLIVLEGDGDCPGDRSEVFEGTRAVGALRSCVPTDGGWIGRALIKASVLARNPPLTLSGGEILRGAKDGG